MNKTTEQYKQEIIDASKVAVEELIKVLQEPIITNSEEDVSADRLKNAAACKKLACFDAFEILTRIDSEQLNISEPDNKDKGHGIAESRARGKTSV